MPNDPLAIKASAAGSSSSPHSIQFKNKCLKKRRAIFLDRDGVLNEDRGYVYRPKDLTWCKGAMDALVQLAAADFLLIVVTNQSGVARGYYREEDVIAFHAAMQLQLSSARGIELDAFYYCPHHPQGTVTGFTKVCTCRKPQPGLLNQARRDFSISLKDSWMVGDKPTDVLCGQQLKLSTIQIGHLHPRAAGVTAVFPGLIEATECILWSI